MPGFSNSFDVPEFGFSLSVRLREPLTKSRSALLTRRAYDAFGSLVQPSEGVPLYWSDALQCSFHYIEKETVLWSLDWQSETTLSRVEVSCVHWPQETSFNELLHAVAIAPQSSPGRFEVQCMNNGGGE